VTPECGNGLKKRPRRNDSSSWVHWRSLRFNKSVCKGRCPTIRHDDATLVLTGLI
jgi:hypothetical protein